MLVEQLVLILAAVDVSLSLVLEAGLNYSVIEATGKTCPGLDRCQMPDEQAAGVHENDWKRRNCFCDDQVSCLFLQCSNYSLCS